MPRRRTPLKQQRPAIEPGRMYTVVEAARCLRLHVSRVRQAVEAGQLPYQAVGVYKRFLGQWLIDWVQSTAVRKKKAKAH